jgi:hypothetical protein
VLPSEYCPVATNCWFWPIVTEGFAGVTEIDCSAGGVTVTVKAVEPLTELNAALTVVVPTVNPAASPAETLATPGLDEFQVAALVRSWVLLSLYVPVAVNCCVLPTSTDGLPGLTAMPVSTAAVTVRIVELLTDPSNAVIVLWPGTNPVAIPLELIEATEDVREPQVTEVVRFCVLPSLNNPVAVNA